MLKKFLEEKRCESKHFLTDTSSCFGSSFIPLVGNFLPPPDLPDTVLCVKRSYGWRDKSGVVIQSWKSSWRKQTSECQVFPVPCDPWFLTVSNRSWLWHWLGIYWKHMNVLEREPDLESKYTLGQLQNSRPWGPIVSVTSDRDLLPQMQSSATRGSPAMVIPCVWKPLNPQTQRHNGEKKFKN